ncbi:GntR family transcriptional regulator [Agrococcus sp. Marseille-Q4369]|uniref:GntR family transcriptional regulator n=1 Tax=Agrococcus sp. Marseille-Q4369 TaxID=2810513 RepID=UPI001B8CAE9C|nr:GntR family transcriptional regulator [Agrococcus sp. Marseille-Q4369]QUW17853.1 GntR family transcriptional regulator [Agrococcus sp. Marseille-Q4369]
MSLSRSEDDALADIAAYLRLSSAPTRAADRAVFAVREAILDGVIEPGTWLREEALSQALAMSRTPLREALNRLRQEGLVESPTGAGLRVTELRPDDLAVVYQVRAALEGFAAELAALRATDRSVRALQSAQEEMRAAAEQQDRLQFVRGNARFHEALAEAARNAYLQRLLGPVHVAIRRFQASNYHESRMQEIVTEHDAIIAGIVSGSPEAARQASEAHADAARTETFHRIVPFEQE